MRFCLLVCLVACGGGDATPDAGLSPSCVEAVNHADLAWLQENVFTPGCSSFSECHQGVALKAQGLNLEAGMTHASLVGQASKGFPDETLVVAGSPSTSYIMVALGSRSGQLSMVGTMPPNNPLLCAEKRAAVERWIAAGALP